jgi:hypothetical protein
MVGFAGFLVQESVEGFIRNTFGVPGITILLATETHSLILYQFEFVVFAKETRTKKHDSPQIRQRA